MKARGNSPGRFTVIATTPIVLTSPLATGASGGLERINWKTPSAPSAKAATATPSSVLSEGVERHVVMQFAGPAGPGLRAELAAQGIVLLKYLGSNAYFAKVPGAACFAGLSEAARDGAFGLDGTSAGWLYRNDTTAHITAGDTLTCWIRGIESGPGGHISLGFGSSDLGTYALTARVDASELVLERHDFYYSATRLNSVSQTFALNKWYRIEVQWDAGDVMTGRVYDSDGTTLLSSVAATDTSFNEGGIAFSGAPRFQADTVVRNGSARSPFKLDNAPALPFTLHAGESFTAGVVFRPAIAGDFTDSLIVGSNDLQNPTAIVRVAFNSVAGVLPPSIYTTPVVFSDGVTGLPVNRSISLAIHEPMAVTPSSGMSARGVMGGPFTPASLSYTVTNASSVDVSWMASANQPWLEVTPSSGTLPSGDGLKTLRAQFADNAGNVSLVVSASIALDTTAPVATLASTALDPADLPIPVDVTLSEPSPDFGLASISAVNATVGSLTGDGTHFTFILTPIAQGYCSCIVPAGAFTDRTGHPNTEPSNKIERIYDTISPQPVMTSTAPEHTKQAPIPVKVKFNKPVTGFTASDIQATNASVANFAGTDADYTFDLVPSGQGRVSASIAAGICADTDGHPNLVAIPLSRIYDTVSPTASIVLVTQTPSSADTVVFDVTFNEPVGSSFNASDIALAPGSLGGAVQASGTDPDYTVTISLTNPNADGSVGITLGTGVADLAGNSYAGGVSPSAGIYNWRGFQTQPSGAVKAYIGGRYTFQVQPDCGANAFAYQWWFDDGTSPISLPGANATDLTLDPVTTHSAGCTGARFPMTASSKPPIPPRWP